MKRKEGTTWIQVDGLTLSQEKIKPVLTQEQALRKRIKDQESVLKRCVCANERVRLERILDLMEDKLKRTQA